MTPRLERVVAYLRAHGRRSRTDELVGEEVALIGVTRAELDASRADSGPLARHARELDAARGGGSELVLVAVPLGARPAARRRIEAALIGRPR